MPGVRERLAALGLAPSKARGQNFLRSPATADMLLDRLGLDPGDRAIEIGPGLGDLTRALAARVERVVAIEVDRGLVRALEQVGLPDNVELRAADALAVDLVALAHELGAPTVLVGNLPYSISGKLLAKILIGIADAGSPPPPRAAGFMLQAEVADRLLAEPGTHAYGSLSVWARLFAPARRLVDLGPDAFVPRPKVRSTFVVLEPATASRIGTPDVPVQTLERVVRAAFGQRRKTLRRALRTLERDAHPELGGALEGVLRAAGIDGQRRGETLTEREFVELAAAVERASGASLTNASG